MSQKQKFGEPERPVIAEMTWGELYSPHPEFVGKTVLQVMTDDEVQNQGSQQVYFSMNGHLSEEANRHNSGVTAAARKAKGSNATGDIQEYKVAVLSLRPPKKERNPHKLWYQD